MNLDHEVLENLYQRYTHRSFVHPDPLETLYAFENSVDVEVAGLVAGLMAYGRVEQILKSLQKIFSLTGPRPGDWLCDQDPAVLERHFTGFRHRFAHGGHMAGLMGGIRGVLVRHGSLRAAFALHDRGGDILEGLTGFVGEILRDAPADPGHLLPRPDKGSACKRLHLFLRWMVRKDAVDVGIWEDVGPRRLLVPLDVHMHRIALSGKMTDRKSGDIKTTREITRAFARFAPEDPVRYDFALTRIGIFEKKTPETFFIPSAPLQGVIP
ncbi:TIGR02757 family protein [Desulfobotulus sp.]|jgi:uncharacterized protein (TIGR02757 family)|uniref:TIGR02757 family protein n=1 Tax=Desulfobotulus sp. TaxID=1940337 RepID=UPI002A367F37|nr:TIGR02757 family protein [Desulfobotulus sp.]MDY0163333.1 TIGR02757 family protein [Desulfobotulus sp.]